MTVQYRAPARSRAGNRIMAQSASRGRNQGADHRRVQAGGGGAGSGIREGDRPQGGAGQRHGRPAHEARRRRRSLRRAGAVAAAASRTTSRAARSWPAATPGSPRSASASWSRRARRSPTSARSRRSSRRCSRPSRSATSIRRAAARAASTWRACSTSSASPTRSSRRPSSAGRPRVRPGQGSGEAEIGIHQISEIVGAEGRDPGRAAAGGDPELHGLCGRSRAPRPRMPRRPRPSSRC